MKNEWHQEGNHQTKQNNSNVLFIERSTTLTGLAYSFSLAATHRTYHICINEHMFLNVG